MADMPMLMTNAGKGINQSTEAPISRLALTTGDASLLAVVEVTDR